MIRDYCKHEKCKIYDGGRCEFFKRITIVSERSRPWTGDMCERKK